MRVNGLYGHVRSNDARSLALFAGFVVAFHVLTALGLFVPLAMYDPDHAPLYAWGGYFVRWVPTATIVGALVFAVQMAWHVRMVRRKTDFRFVDDSDEPRLCRIVEPLTIAAGLPTPYVGIIDSPAMNAFACGIRRKDAVLVFTRGLIDGLDDDELAAVAAHEITHIVNGDIRLIAATNVCLDTMNLLQTRTPKERMKRIWQGATLPFLAVGMPIMVVLVLVMMFLRRLAVDGSHLVRLLIASAREFIADAEAVRLTQNPAALVSALRRIDGRSVIEGLAAGQDAMMIDGAHKGALATHPTIADRIAAIISVTGSMALNAPARRDTRGDIVTRRPSESARASFGRRPTPALAAAAAQQAESAHFARANPGGFNRLGLTPELTLGAIAAIGVFLWTHAADLTRPAALASALDPAPWRTFFDLGREGTRCQTQGLAWVAGRAEHPEHCDPGSMLAGHRGEANMFGKMADAMPEVGENSSGVFTRSDGTFGNVARPEDKLAEVQSARCFETDRYSVGDRGLHSVTEEPHGDISLPRYLGYSDGAARNVGEAATPADRDLRLIDYFKVRKLMGETIHRFFGNPGLEAEAARYASPDHEAAIALLQQRLSDPGFAVSLSPLERAELKLLATAPTEFVSCTARRAQGQVKAAAD
jgi:Zn-dependent protease with chaperone function